MPTLNAKKPIVPEWGVYEQYATHWGATATVAAATSALRSAEYGQRDALVDLLSDLLEGDPHTHSVYKKVAAGISNQDWEIVPAEVEDDSEIDNADLIAKVVHSTIAQIPRWRSHLYGMLWGGFFGVAARETMWGYDGARWWVDSLRMVANRRINYDDYYVPYVSETGYVNTDSIYFRDYPGKFLLFEPVVCGEQHQTREGVGRIILFWMAFKRFGARGLMEYTERFGKPFPLAKYNTTDSGEPAPADEDTIASLKTLVKQIGRGSQPGAVFPDSVELELVGPGGDSGSSGSGENTVHKFLVALCNAEISKAILGNTLTTEVGSTGGNRALGERQGEDQHDIYAALARQMDECITRDLVYWIVRLNFGERGLDYLPRYHTKIERQENLAEAAEILKILVDSGLTIPAAQVRERFGYRAPLEDEEVLGGKPEPTQAKPPEAPDQDDPAPEDPEDEDDAGEAEPAESDEQ